MTYENLANINRVIEFIHENKNNGLKDSGRFEDSSIKETLAELEYLRQEIINNL